MHFTGYGKRYSFPYIESALSKGMIDVFCGMLRRPEREVYAMFIEPPLYASRHKLMARAEDTVVVNDLDDLVALTPNNLIISTNGTAFPTMLRHRGLTVDDTSSDNRVNVRKLIGGRGRFFYNTDMVLNHLQKHHPDRDKLRVLPHPMVEEVQYLALGKSLPPNVAQQLERALRKLKEQGELDRIFRYYAEQ